MQDEQLHEVAQRIWYRFNGHRRPTAENNSRGPAWRDDRHRAIKRVTAKKRERLLRYLGSEFGATRIDELSDMQLDAAWREVSGW